MENALKYKNRPRNFQAQKKYNSVSTDNAYVVRRATGVGPVELMNLLGYALREKPRELRKIEKKYVQHCVWLYRRLEQVGR